MGILKDFSEKQKNYLLYQGRLEAEYLRNTWEAELEKKEMALKKIQKEMKKIQKETKKIQKETQKYEEIAKKALKDEEKALKETEKENERLLLLLKKPGLIPIKLCTDLIWQIHSK